MNKRTAASERVIRVTRTGVNVLRDENGRNVPEYQREAFCPIHKKNSKDFTGINEAGWIFRCAGFTKAEVKSLKRQDKLNPAVAGLYHYFVSDPA